MIVQLLVRVFELFARRLGAVVTLRRFKFAELSGD